MGAVISEKLEKTKVTDISPSYTPIIAVVASTWMLALATDSGLVGFMGYTLVFFAALKLMDINLFAVGFREYDIVAQTFDPYAYLYPFLELFIGLSILSGQTPLIVGITSFIVGFTGSYSIVKAAYVEGKDLRCGCIGGYSDVPLGMFSLLENLIMAFMGLWLMTFSM